MSKRKINDQIQFLSKYNNIEFCDVYDQLLNALKVRNKKQIKFIIKCLANTTGCLNFQNAEGLSLVHYAIIKDKDSISVSKCLLDAGANKDVRDSIGETPMHYAAKYGDLPLIEYLIKINAKKNLKNIDDVTPIHYAARYGYTNIIKCLLDTGADKDARDSVGQTPMHYAARYGYTNIIKCLLDTGADKDARDSIGQTPMHYAIEGAHVVLVKQLLDAGADKDARDFIGQTPIHYAIEFILSDDNSEIIKFLISAGANLERRNKNGLTALELANYNDLYTEAKLLCYAKLTDQLCTTTFQVDNEDKYTLESLSRKSNEIKYLFSKRILSNVIAEYFKYHKINKMQSTLNIFLKNLSSNLETIKKIFPNVDLSFLTQTINKAFEQNSSFISLFQLSALSILESGVHKKINKLPYDCKDRIKDISEVFCLNLSKEMYIALNTASDYTETYFVSSQSEEIITPLGTNSGFS